MTLNSHSPLPLYQQLADRIRHEVTEGAYVVHEKIPSENELAKKYAIGRPTVRQATDLLVREGVLLRKRGSGTFVRSAVQQIDLFSLAGTSAAFDQGQQPVKMNLLQPVSLLADDDYCPPVLMDKPVYRLQRLSCVDDEPVLLECFYLDAELFRGIEQHVLEGDSLSRIVREVFFMEASEAEQTFTIAYPDKFTADNLQVNSRSPLLQVSRTLHFGDYRAAIYCDIYCRTDRFHFSQTLTARV